MAPTEREKTDYCHHDFYRGKRTKRRRKTKMRRREGDLGGMDRVERTLQAKERLREPVPSVSPLWR